MYAECRYRRPDIVCSTSRSLNREQDRRSRARTLVATNRRRQPVSLRPNELIEGWTEALQMMPLGAECELFIPADLACGDRGAGRDIAPGDALIFEVERSRFESRTSNKSAP